MAGRVLKKIRHLPTAEEKARMWIICSVILLGTQKTSELIVNDARLLSKYDREIGGLCEGKTGK